MADTALLETLLEAPSLHDAGDALPMHESQPHLKPHRHP